MGQVSKKTLFFIIRYLIRFVVENKYSFLCEFWD